LYAAGLINKGEKIVVPLLDADLSGANLSGSHLNGAELCHADLQHADLSGADLSRADLRIANLSDANLSDANLSKADLRKATVTKEQLSRCESLEGATMPDGKKYEDWLKDLEQLAKRLVHESLWSDGCLFGRSQTRDSRGCPAAAHEQKRGCPRFRGQPLLCQALREGCMPRALP